MGDQTFHVRDPESLINLIGWLSEASRRCYDVHIGIVSALYGPAGIKLSADERDLAELCGKAMTRLQQAYHTAKRIKEAADG